MNASGTPGGTGHAERVAQPAGVLDGGPALLAGDPHLDDPARRRRAATASRRGVGAVDAPRRDLVGGQRAEQPQQVGDALGVARLPVVGEPLQLALDLGEHVGVEQLAQLGPAEQLGEQRRSSASAAARRSASGESPSYRNAPT